MQPMVTPSFSQKQPHTSVSMSVFCDNANWHKFLGSSESIKNFLRGLPYLLDYHLSFSAEQGQHLRFIFFTKQANSTLKEELKNYFQSRLKYCCIKNRDADFEETFFMNFPSPSVYSETFKSYNKSSEILCDEIVREFKSLISQMILNELTAGEIDDDILLSFGMMIQCQILNTMRIVGTSTLFLLRESILVISAGFKAEQLVEIDLHVSKLFRQNDMNISELAACSTLENDKIIRSRWVHLFDCIKAVEKKDRTVFIELTSLLFDQLNLKRKLLFLLSVQILYKINLNKSINYKSNAKA